MLCSLKASVHSVKYWIVPLFRGTDETSCIDVETHSKLQECTQTSTDHHQVCLGACGCETGSAWQAVSSEHTLELWNEGETLQFQKHQQCKVSISK